MRIRRTFSLAGIINGAKESRMAFSIVPILYKRSATIVDDDQGINVTEKRLSGGSLFNLRYTRDSSWWLEATTGVEKETLDSKSTSTCYSVSKAWFDDIVLAAGYNIFFNTHKAQCVIYGLAGLPTSSKVTLQERFGPLVGTRLFSLGAGLEFSYAFRQELKRSFIVYVQSRLIHFFNRSWDPILPRDAELQPGNVIDLLFAMRFREKKNIYEVGYNPTFFTNEAILLRNREIKSDNFIRQGGYIYYSRIFEKMYKIKKPVTLGSGLSISSGKKFDTNIVSWWINITTVF